MTDPAERSTPVLEEIRGRRLFQWVFGYVAGAWILLELTDFLVGHLGGPPALVGLLLAALAFGLLAAIVLAWFHGEKGRQEVTRLERFLLAGIAGAGFLTLGWLGATASWDAEGGDPSGAEARNRGAGVAFLAGGARDAEAQVVLADPREAPLALAVLPLAGVEVGLEGSGAFPIEAFADGITDDLLFELSLVPGLRVISRTSTAPYRDTPLSLVEIARQLDVELVLEGSVRRAADQVRIVVQLVDARADELLWSGAYDRELADILAVQVEVAGEIAAAIAGLLGPAEAPAFDPVRRVSGPGRLDEATVVAATEGRRLVRSADPDSVMRGVALLREVLEREPGLRTARAALAELLEGGASRPADPAALSGAERAEVRAILDASEARLEARGSEAVRPETSQAWRLALDRGSLAEAETALVEILRANPNDASARQWYGLLLAGTGRPEAGLEQLQVARVLSPEGTGARGMAGIGASEAALLAALGRHDEALVALDRELGRLGPDAPPRISLEAERALVLAATGRLPEALRSAGALVEAHPTSATALAAWGLIRLRTGDTRGAEEARARIQALAPSSGPAALTRALGEAQLAAALGDHGAARALLTEATGEQGWLALSAGARRVRALLDASTPDAAPGATSGTAPGA